MAERGRDNRGRQADRRTERETMIDEKEAGLQYHIYKLRICTK
jgi:hypothetical protein